jgi:tRNA(Ile)-lysidine synthetase-like protein
MREEKWQPPAGVHFWRPLLHLTRMAIRDSLRSRGILWKEDPTNESPLHRRNRLRAGILPLLAQEEPAAVALLARSARLCGEAADLLAALAQEDLAHAIVAGDQGILVLKNGPLQALSRPRLAIVLRSAWSLLVEGRFPLPPPARWTDSLAERILTARGATSTFEASVVHVRVDAHHTLLHSSSIDPGKAVEFLMNATRPGILLPTPHAVMSVANSSQRTSLQKSRIVLGEGQGTLDLEVMESSSLLSEQLLVHDPASLTAFFDSSSIRRDLVLRAARHDESIAMGPAGSKDVAAALQESGIPAELRPRVAVLADDRGILWIPGIRRAVSAYVTDRTSLVLKLSWNRTNLEESPRA